MSELVQTIKTDDVLFAWSLVIFDFGLLLTDLIQMWITIHRFSIASKLIDNYKEATRLTTKEIRHCAGNYFSSLREKGNCKVISTY